jgi:hypothetical protein
MVTVKDKEGKIVYEALTEKELEETMRILTSMPGEKATFEQILRIIRERNYPL